jgi:DNA polymerase-1
MIALVEAQGYFRLLNGQKRRFDKDLQIIRSLRDREEAGSGQAKEEARKRTYALTRELMNNTGQGGAAVIINTAIYLLWKNRKFLQDNKVHLLLQVHDELVFEVPKTVAKKVMPWIRDKMEEAGKLNVPVIANIGQGMDWETAK